MRRARVLAAGPLASRQEKRFARRVQASARQCTIWSGGHGKRTDADRDHRRHGGAGFGTGDALCAAGHKVVTGTRDPGRGTAVASALLAKLGERGEGRDAAGRRQRGGRGLRRHGHRRGPVRQPARDARRRPRRRPRPDRGGHHHVAGAAQGDARVAVEGRIGCTDRATRAGRGRSRRLRLPERGCASFRRHGRGFLRHGVERSGLHRRQLLRRRHGLRAMAVRPSTARTARPGRIAARRALVCRCMRATSFPARVRDPCRRGRRSVRREPLDAPCGSATHPVRTHAVE